MIQLTVNGEKYTTGKNTVKQLLDEMEIIPERVAVEVNLRVIRKTEFEQHTLHDGDIVEIVYFVGGGHDTYTAVRRQNSARKNRRMHE